MNKLVSYTAKNALQNVKYVQNRPNFESDKLKIYGLPLRGIYRAYVVLYGTSIHEVRDGHVIDLIPDAVLMTEEELREQKF